MAKQIPDTGQAVTMGRARNAYGLGSSTVTLSAGLGGAANIHLSGSGAVTLQPFPFSSRLGGRQTPNEY